MGKQGANIPVENTGDLKIFSISLPGIARICLISAILLFNAPTHSQYVRVPVETCPDSFALINGVCVHQIETQKIPSCPEGFVSRGSECYSAEPLLKECPTGFQMQDKQCVREIFAEREKYCFDGLDFDHTTGKCFYKEEVKAVCPPGSVHFRDSCAVVREPMRICQEPLKLDQETNMCIERKAAFPTPICPEPFVFNISLKMCVRDKIEAKSCPEGFKDVDDNSCAKWTQPEYICPEGTQVENVKHQSLCRSVKYSTPILECPPGSVLEGQICISASRTNSRVCPMGFVEVEDQCVNFQEPLFHCPEGYEKTLHNGIKVCFNNLSVEPRISCPNTNSYFDESTKLCISESVAERECPENSFRSKDSCFKKVKGEWECPLGTRYNPENHLCQEILTIEPHIICPPNSKFEQSTSTCVGYESNIQVCPPGYEEVGENECAVFVPPKRSCPDLQSLINGQCEEVVLTPTEITCPPGSEQSDSACILKSDNSSKRKCPLNSIDSGDHCSIIDSPEKHCIEGYKFNSETEKCTKVTTRHPDPICKEPGILNSKGECIYSENLPKICPGNSKEDPDNEHFCILESEPKLSCPEGYKLIDGKCIKESRVGVKLTCPFGYELNDIDNNCHKTIQRNYVCPPGFLDNGDRCYKTSKPTSVCPEGFAREGEIGDCIQIEISESKSRCPEGSIPLSSGMCGAKKPLPLEYKCLQGTKVGDSCLVETFMDASYECPKGYFLSEIKQCQRVVEYDCSEVSTVSIPCDSGVNTINTSNIGYYGQGRSGICSQVVRNQKTCSRTEAFPPKVSCPPGSINIGKECQKKEHLPMTRVCSDPARSLENCFQDLVIPKVKDCPIGSNMTEDNRCASIHRKAPELVCREGYNMEEGNCIQLASKMCPPEGCTVRNIIDSNRECPSGFEFKDGICKFIHQVLPERKCDRGELSSLNEQICIERMIKICSNSKCEVVHKQAPELICEQDETLNLKTKLCEKIIVGPQMLRCTKPFKLIGDQCVHQVSKECSGGNCSVSISVPPRISCKVGTLISNKQCESIKRSPSILSCPRDFTLQGDLCAKYTYKECLNNQCEKRVNYPPIIECPSQYSIFPGGNCSKSIHHIPQIKCPIGSDLINSYCIKEVESVCPVEGCLIRETQPPLLTCPSGFQKNSHNLNNGMPICTKRLFNNGQITCPEGAIMSNGSCITYSIKECYKDNCDEIKTISPIQVCPDGTKLVDGNICKESKIVPKDLICPSEGYLLDGDKCILYKEKTCSSKNCRRQITLEPDMVCPSGFRLDKAICIWEKYQSTQSSCPRDSIMINEQCFTMLKKECPNGTCENKIYFEPTSRCPKGFVEVGNKCIMLEYSGQKKICPPGLILKKNHCIRFAQATFKCPNGFTEEGEKCIKTVKTEPIVTYDSQCVGNQCNLSSSFNVSHQKHVHHDHSNVHTHHKKQKKHH
ncbi:oocyst wall protein 2 [Cryptosporidium canis]|nr:oocyst wall protein 2 [Cryptosporidium canis]